MSEIGEIIIEIEKSEEDSFKPHHLNRDFLGKRGVWVLLGSDGGERLLCLNVGKTTDIGREVLYDASCVMNLKSPTNPDRGPYINQFQEDCGFEWESNKTRECLYPILAKRFKRLIFVLATFADNDEEARKMESHIAKKLHAIYWRNGKSYEKKKWDSPHIDQQNSFSNMEVFVAKLREN